jgi:glucose/arabinose dehydrogenase
MRSRHRASVAALVLVAGGCGVGAEAPADPVTRPFEPAPSLIRLADLPPPNHTPSVRRSPKVVPPPAEAVLRAPPGFVVRVYYRGDLDQPRWLALTPEGDVLVTETRRNRIRRLRDTDRDGVADEASIFADESNGLDIPFGMAFAPGWFYLGNTNAVVRFPYRDGAARLQGRGERIAELPGGGYNQHWTRNVRVAPDGERLFVTVGSASNDDEEPPPRAAVLRMKLDGSAREVFADGLRNPVGLDFHPRTGEPYVTVNERDGLGDDLVPDYLTRVRAGEFYGWPWAYLSPAHPAPRYLRGGRSTRPDAVARTRMPDVLIEAHAAALGLAFARGDAFPPRYRNGAFVACRGSWNRSRGSGYKIVFVPFGDDGRPLGHYEDFVTGFLVDPAGPTTWGRPVGVLALPDGSLLFTEEANERVYRVTYRP